MHATDLVDLAGFAATHVALISREHSEWSPIANEKYWAASRCRLNRWGQSLKLFQVDVSQHHPVYSPWPAIELVAGEILISEMLTRVWAAIAQIHDEQFGADTFESVARSVLVGHLEARNRVLKLIVAGDREHRLEAGRLNRLRQKTERWTDLLLGNLGHSSAFEYGFDAERVEDFAEDNHDLVNSPDSPHWHLMMSSLHDSFLTYRAGAAINGDLNEEVFGAIMSCYPTEMFDATGPYHSLWLTRIMSGADKTHRLIDHFLRLELKDQIEVETIPAGS